MIGEMRRLISLLAAALFAAGSLAAAGGAMAEEHREARRAPPPRSEAAPRWAGAQRQAPAAQAYRNEAYRAETYRSEAYDPRSDPRAGAYRADPRYDPRTAAPPPANAYSAAPRRGGYLGPGSSGAVIQDYGRYRLRPPPRGYAWVRTPGGMALMSQSTGQVFDVVPY